VMPLVVNAKFAEAGELYSDILYQLEKAESMCPYVFQQPNDFVHTNYQTSWCAARIKMNYIALLISGLIEHAPNPPYSPEALAKQRRVCLQQTARMSADIIEGLPISSGGCAIDPEPDSLSAGWTGLRLVWPLTAMYMIPSVPTQHRLVAKAALLRIGRDLGILQALRGYSVSKKFPREALISFILDREVVTDGYLPDVCSSPSPNSSLR
jgi:hypothetical protein